MATRKARHQNQPDASLARRIAAENPRRFQMSISHPDREAANVGKITAILSGLDDSTKGERDKALLLVGFAGVAISEIAAIHVEHIERSQKGVEIKIPPLETNFVEREETSRLVAEST
jgi:hypothetical protein